MRSCEVKSDGSFVYPSGLGRGSVRAVVKFTW